MSWDDVTEDESSQDEYRSFVRWGDFEDGDRAVFDVEGGPVPGSEAGSNLSDWAIPAHCVTDLETSWAPGPCWITFDDETFKATELKELAPEEGDKLGIEFKLNEHGRPRWTFQAIDGEEYEQREAEPEDEQGGAS